MSPLLIYKILTLFVNTLTADDKNYLFNRDNLMQPIQMQWSPKQQIFLKKIFFFFFAFFISILNFKHFPKTMTLIADVFADLPARKDMIR